MSKSASNVLLIAVILCTLSLNYGKTEESVIMAGHGEPGNEIGNDIVGGVETSISKKQQSERDRQYDIILGVLNGAQPGASPVPLREGTPSSEAEARTSSTAAATSTEGSTTANAASTTTTAKPTTSTTTSIPTPAVYLPVNFTYPSRIYAIAKAFNFTDLKELNFTYVWSYHS